MKKFFVMAVLVMVSACTVIRREAGYPGGNIGYYADQKLYTAHTHEQRVDRHLILLAVLAPLAAQTAQNEEDAELSIASINSVYQGLVRLKKITDVCNFRSLYGSDQDIGSRKILSSTPMGDVTQFSKKEPRDLSNREQDEFKTFSDMLAGKFTWEQNGLSIGFEGILKATASTETAENQDETRQNVTLLFGDLKVSLVTGANATNNCANGTKILEGSAFEFETANLRVQKALFRLLRASADNLGIKITRGNPANVSILSVANLLRKARNILPVLANYLATFRDISIIYADAVADECGDKHRANTSCGKLRAHFTNGFLHDQANVAEDDVFRPINNMMKLATAAGENEAAGWELQSRQVSALFRHVDIACKKLEAEAGVTTTADDTTQTDRCSLVTSQNEAARLSASNAFKKP